MIRSTFLVLLLAGCASNPPLLQQLRSVDCEIKSFERSDHRERAECWEPE